MATTLYLCPGVTDVDAKGQTRRYGKGWYTTLSAYAKQQFYMGLQDTFLVGVQNISVADDNTMTADSTISKIPPLANKIGAAALPTVQSKLEALNLPSDFVSENMSYQTLVHYVYTFCFFMQAYNGDPGGHAPLLFDGTVTLDTTFNSLPQVAKTALPQTATALGFSTAGISGTTKMRAIFKAIGDQWAGVKGTIVFAGVVL